MLVFFGNVALFLAFFYLVLLLGYVIGWQLCKTVTVPDTFTPSQKISIIIPARNEELYIEECLRSVLENKFAVDLFEVIIINDFSTDKTAEIITELQSEYENLKAIHLEQVLGKNVKLNSYKKYALNLAIQQAEGNFIITTDADCIVPPNWLQYFAFMFEVKNANFVTAPVVFHNETSMLERFQTLDFMGMMCVTGASLHWKWAAMSNGANLGYPKAIYKAVNGFEGVNQLASGDDLLLMEKILKYTNNKNIFFLKAKDTIVKTVAAKTLNEFFNQRVRWASKSQVYQSWGIKLALVMVLLFNLMVLFSFFMWLFGAISFNTFIIPFVIKMQADFIFLFNTSLYFNRTELMLYFLPAQIWHLLYICTVGIWGNIGTYKWKDRKVK